MKTKKIKQKGFTLVELVVYMGIFTILLFVLTSLFTSMLDTQLETNSLSSVQQDNRFIMTRLTRDIQAADSITIPATIGASTSNLEIVINGATYTYSLAGDNLTLVNGLGTNVLNNFDTSISNLSFLRLGNTAGKNTITVSLTSTSKTQKASGPEVKNIKFTVGTR